MGARISVKALIVEKEHILLNRCEDEANGVYYTLPGGGQELYESLEEAVVREVREETGYTVKPCRLAGLSEEIFTDPFLQEHYPAYTHRLYPIFLCTCSDEPRIAPTETDISQKGCEWIALSMLPRICIFPRAVQKQLPALLTTHDAQFLGTDYTDKNHG